MRASVVEGPDRVLNLSGAKLDRAHNYVILNHGRTLDMRRYEHMNNYMNNHALSFFLAN